LFRGKIMADRKKVEEKTLDLKYVNKISNEFTFEKETITFQLKLPGEPENYVRERYTGRGNRFYNAKEGIMKEIKRKLRALVPPNKKTEIEDLIKNKDANYYVSLELRFFLKIPTNDSIKDTILKEYNVKRPAIRADLDNYIKLIVDTLHDVIYDDDKRVISINSEKFYSLDPRTEINIEIEIFKKGKK